MKVSILCLGVFTLLHIAGASVCMLFNLGPQLMIHRIINSSADWFLDKPLKCQKKCRLQIPEAQGDVFFYVFCSSNSPKPPHTQFVITCDKEKHQICTFKKLWCERELVIFAQQRQMITEPFFSFNIIEAQSSGDQLSQSTCSHILIGWCCIHFLVRRGLNQEVECRTWDPTSSHDLRKWERGAHRDGQHAAEWREQTAPGHRQAPGPHTCHRRLCHPGGSRAVPCLCKCPISALTSNKTW